ncbi:MAG TPA: DUF3800 domain-containing protein [Candidatus Angelobacter sp.]|jgi:hypothetical protein|nr:DUF3800 domain-containing protein [Candidatus Angelobacter sp.]
MAIMYCYFDESGKHKDHPVVTFSGVCITQSKLQQFDDAWNALLRQYGMPWLHMKEVSQLSRKICEKMPYKQSEADRNEALVPFADCINEHFEYGLIQAMDVDGFNSLSKNAKYQLGHTDDPYYIAFVRGLLELVNYVQGDDNLSIICDDDKDTAWDCYRHYRGVRRAHAEIREKTVSLTFADDKYFPSLQAADMLAFLSRLEAKMRFHNFRYSFRKIYLSLTNDRGIGFTQWKAAFIDKAKFQGLSDALDRKQKKSGMIKR